MLISRRGGSLIYFLELQLEIGVHSRVMVGMFIQNLCLFSDDQTLSSYE